MSTRRSAVAGGAPGKAVRPPRPPRRKSLERVRDISFRSFVEDFFEPRRPVVLEGAAAGWGASSSWDLDYLLSIVGDIALPIFKSRSRIFRPEVNHAYDRMRVPIRLSDYATMVREGGARDGYFYYLATTPFAGHYPVLERDVDFSRFLTKKARLEPNIWISTSGTVSPLHFDPYEKHNFHAVIRGRKRFLLYEPGAGHLLAPYPREQRIKHFSRVDLNRLDLRRFPDFHTVQGLECVVGEGDMLFMPMWWWHHVTTEVMTISVNLWWPERALRKPRGGRGRGGREAGARPAGGRKPSGASGGS